MAAHRMDRAFIFAARHPEAILFIFYVVNKVNRCILFPLFLTLVSAVNRSGAAVNKTFIS